ncbi:hypothetical protein BT96DRAFT_919700 [Gymnopus androsaceus JB14]|uniref:Uncharacterized protein n=1 Tax=Gymnopus androsaceus JB14 TaxID=1447944 RepID=A0A6A4HS51_9AGAR|nr:hypothetical protein BT96DRAFT_919700 [Gymnopus androsaceus JB14]
MFSPAWLLYSLLVSHSIDAAFSAQISAPTGAASPTVTGTWVLQKGDPPQASQGFIVQLLRDEPSGEKLEDDSTVGPQRMSTGTVELIATSTGTHRLQIVLPSPSSNFSGSSKHSTSQSIKSTSKPSSSVSSKTSTTTSTTESHASNPSTTLKNDVSSTSTSPSTFILPSSTTALDTLRTPNASSIATGSSIPADGAKLTTEKPNLIATILSVIFATILFIILLLVAVSADPSESSTIAQQWYNSSRSAPGDGTLSDFSTLAPSDSNTTTRWQKLKLGYRGGLFEKNLANIENDDSKEELTAVDGIHVGGPVPVIQVTSVTATNSSIVS